MRKTTKFVLAAFLAGVFAMGLGAQAFAECAGHTKTVDTGLDSKTVADGGMSTKSGG